MTTISIESFLPELVMLTAALALLWLLFWLATRALRRWAVPNGVDDAPTPMNRWSQQVTRWLRHVTSTATLIIAVLVMLHGMGMRTFPTVSWASMAEWIRSAVLPLLFILGSAFVLIRATSLATDAMVQLRAAEHLPLAEQLDRRKRTETRARLLRWTITAVVLAIAVPMALRTLGVDITPLLAGGAIFSVAIGFGAQNLLRDIIGGVSMILEDQLRVGDIASINGKSGQVEALNLRTTVLRGFDGTVHILSNGEIKELSNRTKNFSYYVIDLGVAYKESVDRVMAVLREIGNELLDDPAYSAQILAPLDVVGVDDFAASAVIIKLRIRTLPAEQRVVGRELRRRIKNRFDAEGIELPFPHLSVFLNDARGAAERSRAE